MNKVYHIYGKKKTFDETKSFVESYYRTDILSNPKDRYNIIVKCIPTNIRIGLWMWLEYFSTQLIDGVI